MRSLSRQVRGLLRAISTWGGRFSRTHMSFTWKLLTYMMYFNFTFGIICFWTSTKDFELLHFFQTSLIFNFEQNVSMCLKLVIWVKVTSHLRGSLSGSSEKNSCAPYFKKKPDKLYIRTKLNKWSLPQKYILSDFSFQ